MGRREIGIAIGVPEPFAAELQAWRERFGERSARAIPPHVTLLPPTAVDSQRLEPIEEHLRAVAAGSGRFWIHLRGSATFRPISPVVFVPLIEGIAPCEQLEARIRTGPLARPLKFPYHPHVTVAQDVPAESLDRAFEQLAGYEARFPVGGFSLFEQGPDRLWRPLRNFAFDLGALGPPPP